MRRATFLTALALLLGAAVAHAEEPRSVVRVRVQPEGDVWVGQKVAVEVEVLSDSFFRRAPRIALPTVPGAIVDSAREAAVNTTTDVDGTSMSGTISRVYVVPQRAGTTTIPPLSVDVAVARPGTQETDEVTIRSRELSFAAKLPPGAEGLTSLVSATSLDVTQTWSAEGESVAVGDALSRVIVFSAPDVLGLAFPPASAPVPEGVAAYPAEPLVEDRAERGEYEGRRTDSVTYVFERPGRVVLPDLVFTWFDVSERKLRRVVLDGRTLEVAPGPIGSAASASQDLGESEQSSSKASWPWGVLLVLLVAGGAVAVALARRRAAVTPPTDTESDAWGDLTRACESGDPRRALVALYAWLDAATPGPMCSTLDALVRTHDVPGLAEAVRGLESAALSGSGRWSGSQLSSTLYGVRASVQDDRSADVAIVPPLNPVAGADGARRPRLIAPWPMVD